MGCRVRFGVGIVIGTYGWGDVRDAGAQFLARGLYPCAVMCSAT